jgi:outer membrane immunogenic protein
LSQFDLPGLGAAASRRSSRRPGGTGFRGFGFCRVILGSLALVAASGFARASDLPIPTRTMPPVAPSVPAQPTTIDWTGFYVGAHGGLGFDHYAFKYVVEVPGAGFTGTDGIDGFGPVLGLQIGFNYQMPLASVPLLGLLPWFGSLPGGFVIGAEIDNSWSGIHGDTTGSGVPPTTQGLATFGGRFANVGTARFRAGYAIDRYFFYVTGGFAYGVTKTYYSLETATGFQSSGVSTDVRSGVPSYVGSLGVGVEYAVTRNVSVRAEYLYDGINAHYELFHPVAGSQVGFGTRTMYHIGRLGVNYRFDWQPPVAVLK